MNWQEVVTTLGGTAAIAAGVGAFVYWLLKQFLQKTLDEKFAERLEDYRHSHTLALQNEKFRLELYDRRFEIFDSIFPFYDAMVSWKGTPEQREARTRFFRAYHESEFLFSEESGIPALLKKLNDDAAKVIGFKEEKDSFKSDPVLMNRLFMEVQDIQTKGFEEGLARLKAAMHSYLDFSKVYA